MLNMIFTRPNQPTLTDISSHLSHGSVVEAQSEQHVHLLVSSFSNVLITESDFQDLICLTINSHCSTVCEQIDGHLWFCPDQISVIVDIYRPLTRQRSVWP